MDEKRWKGAGWVAIGAAALVPLNIILSLLGDTVLAGKPVGVPVNLMAALVGISSMLLSLIAIYRFRELLNERYGFRGIDMLISFLLVVFPIMMLVGATGRVVITLLGTSAASLGITLMFALPMVFFGVVLGVVTILIGVRLLSFEGDIQDLMRPYAIISIIEGALFVLVITAPLGLLLVIVEQIVLALIFFRAAESEPSVEFV